MWQETSSKHGKMGIMYEVMKYRTAAILIMLALFLGVAFGSAVTWFTMIDSGPPISCIERGGVIIIEGPSAVKCSVPA